jgi:hypothetical protein
VAVGRNRTDIISKQKRRDTKDIISFVFNDWGKQMLPEFWDQEKIHCKLDHSNSVNLPKQEDNPPSTARYL